MAKRSWVLSVTPEERTELGSLANVRLQCLFILQLAAKHGTDSHTAAETAAALQHLRIAISGVGVRNALDAAAETVPRLVSRSRSRPRVYRLAQPGERALAAAVGGNIAVVRIEGGKPLTARVRLSEMVAELKGTVRISDPYFGARSADALASCTGATEVRFITGKCGSGENEAAARRILADTTREHGNVHVRTAPAGRLPHDRYVLSDDEMIIVGHGLKDIGSRESYVIRLPRAMLEDTAAQVEKAFDALWLSSASL